MVFLLRFIAESELKKRAQKASERGERSSSIKEEEQSTRSTSYTYRNCMSESERSRMKVAKSRKLTCTYEKVYVWVSVEEIDKS